MSWYPLSEPLVVAHRGYSAKAPENTLAAFRLALESGATHVECDVHASREGTPFVIHDPTVDRTTNGTGRVDALSDDELLELDAGRWKGPTFEGEGVPTLQELLELLSGRANLALEVKALGIEEAVLSEVRASDFPLSSLTLFCFDRDTLIRFRSAEPELHCTHLIAVANDSDWHSHVTRARDEGIAALGPGEHLVTPSRVAEIQAAGLSCFVWTVDERDRIRELRSWGVDALISNEFEQALAAL